MGGAVLNVLGGGWVRSGGACLLWYCVLWEAVWVCKVGGICLGAIVCVKCLVCGEYLVVGGYVLMWRRDGVGRSVFLCVVWV